MKRRPPRSTRPAPRFPYTTLCRSLGKPAAGLACMSDSAAAAAGKVIDPLFWCMGSWGSTYPVAGDIHMGDRVEAWAGLAARGTFMMGRLGALRSEEHTSELQSLMRISYAVFCLKKKTAT